MPVPDRNKLKKILPISKVSVKTLFSVDKLFLFLFFLFSLEFFSYHLIFSRRIIPGVRLSGVDLSGKTYPQVFQILNEKFSQFEKVPLSIKIGRQERWVGLADLGLILSASESARVSYQVGRSRNLLRDLKTEYQIFLFGQTVAPSYRLNREKFESWVAKIYADLAVREARWVIDNGRLELIPEKEGWDFSKEDLEQKILSAVIALEGVAEVEAQPKKPVVTADLLEKNQPFLQRLYSARPIFFYGTKIWTIGDEDFLTLFDWEKSTPTALPLLPSGLSALSQRIAQEINVPARAINFRSDGDRVTSFEPGQDGLAVDLPGFGGLLAEKLILGVASRSEIPVNRIQPSVSANEYGVKELIGEGVSYFAGSIPGRRHNIELASGKLSGILIPPDKIFSFNEAVGEITAATGYDYAYIISEGRTVLGTGGGVCQVSTTLFRAALNAGLPIVKRTAHAYRVGYYEQGGILPGLDATVFAPSVDLQFKNDTGSYILIQSVFENDRNTLIFRLYGGSDGRLVKMEGPTIISSSAPPAPLYQDDPGVPKGTTRQIDFAAGGASVYFKRRVERASGKILEDTFYSNYSPWRAIYLVGTGE